MDKWIRTIISKSRRFRSQKLLGLAHFFINVGITANMMTGLSFLFGLGAVYFFQQNHLWFVILGILHIFVDGLDGVIARVTTPTSFGKYFDFVSDQLTAILLLLKLAWVTGDMMIYLVFILVFLSQLFYALSNLRAPVLFPRMFLFLLLMIDQVTLGFLTAGVIGLYSLALQLKWVIEGRFSER